MAKEVVEVYLGRVGGFRALGLGLRGLGFRVGA